MLVPNKKPNRFRFLYLARHGQYGEDGSLTELGTRQSRRLARHLADKDIPLDRVWCSTMRRAEETADIVCAEAFPELEPSRSWLLRERLFPGLAVASDHDDDCSAALDVLDRIFRRWMRPSRSERHELLVCHGNVIRAIVTRCIDADVATSWHRMTIYHCSLTELACYDHDDYFLHGMNSHAFFPRELVTIV